jgi:two-component system, sensor histidine kinase and response regulator
MTQGVNKSDSYFSELAAGEQDPPKARLSVAAEAGMAKGEEGLTILYVEDEEMTRKTVCSMLARRFPGLVIESAPDGSAGLELFLRLRPDLVITDINMPGMNGIEMTRRIMEKDSRARIIVTSAHSDHDYLIESIEIGVSRYVMKPIDSSKLFAAIDDTLHALRLERERERCVREIELLNRSLEAHTRELEVANRDLEAYGYTVSHDLRNPLTKISGYCQVIMELCADKIDPQCLEFIEIIDRETDTMTNLVNSLLEFSRLSSADPGRGPADLSEIAGAIAAELRLREPERQVLFGIAPGVAADGDPDLMRVVLDNLLSNAWKYTSDNSEAVIEFGVDADGKDGAYFVRDNGAGFAMEEAHRLFNPFQRLHAGYSGLGIGLATVQRIVERHGGRVWAQGDPGRGAVFHFTIPPR